MDPIKGMNQIAQILRQKLGEKKLGQAKSRSDNSSLNRAASSGQAARPSSEEIKRRVGERISVLPEEEQNGTRAAHIFVEQVMVWEFGDHLLQDPQFTELSNEVVKAMAENPTIWRKMQLLLKELSTKT